MQGDHQLARTTETGRLSLYARLADYERRSLAHDVGEAARQQQISNWDGVVFRLGDYFLTCRIDQVDEIIAFPPYTQIPGAKDWLLGIANVRGNLAPVSDLGWFLFGSRTPVTTRTTPRSSRRRMTGHQPRSPGCATPPSARGTRPGPPRCAPWPRRRPAPLRTRRALGEAG